MTKMPTKKDYINTVRNRYLGCSSKSQKSLIINEVVANLNKDRKHVIKILNGKYYKVQRKIRKRRPEKYGYDLRKPLEQIWQVAGKPCSKNLQPQIPEIIRKLKQFNEIAISDRQHLLLCSMGTSTIDKLLRSKRNRLRGKGISGTKRSPLLKSLIPIRTVFEDVDEPGHVELDCVLHCGESAAGKYAETLNTLDIDTHWNEQTAFLNKNQTKVIAALHMQRGQFPFPVKSIDFDNGSEFINWKLNGYCKREKLAFTRSRPYRKNDQAHVEGKNFQSIRKLVGYERIEEESVVELINSIYHNEFRLLNNFFYTTQKLKEKKRVGTSIRKKYHTAQTPYARVLESKQVADNVKQDLMRQYKQLNPAKLQRDLHIKLKRLQRMLMVSKINQATTPS